MFRFASPTVRRRPSLTPMIDVVFLLLIFFMLTAQFTRDKALPLTLGGSGATTYEGPPRLVTIDAETTRLNGFEITLSALPGSLSELTNEPDDLIVLRATENASLQRLVAVMDALRAAGYSNLALVE